MFRRRTDQVYSTLQQVQRRITEQTGVSSPLGDDVKTEEIPPAPPMSSPPGAPYVAQQISLQPLAQALPQTRGAGLPPPLAPLPSSGRRYVLQLSGDLAMLLMVAWLASMAVMFVLGKNWRGAPGAGLAPGAAGNRVAIEATDATASSPSTPAHRLGDYVLVLQSSPNATADIENYFKGRAKELNEYVARNPSHGWKQYFGLRRPSSGGVQLVFGEADGQYGIPRDDYLTFAALLAKPTKDGGAGYASSTWVRVDGP
jgi:hypothetical protein